VRLRLFLSCIAMLPLAGCYLLQATRGQLDLNARRVPVATLLARPDTPPELGRRLAHAQRIRDYASRALGLPDNASYRSYADLGRRYVVWNIYATPPFSVEPRTWCFPVAGCVAYRGYFEERAARDYALGLELHGDDVAVGGVAAYSTLGHFADPILNTMLAWDDLELAALVFHELAHQRVYAPGDTAFNEGFATVVEEEGLRRWLAAEGRSAELALHEGSVARARTLATQVASTRERLRAVYAAGGPPAALRAAKAAEFERLGAALRAGGVDAQFAGRPLNNAVLLEIATYGDCVPALAARLVALGGDLARFYAAMASLATGPAAARRAACTI
jgi:predicted aminopeptidase